MWIFALEALVALAMLVLIVWLTMGGSRRRDAGSAETPPRESDPDPDRDRH